MQGSFHRFRSRLIHLAALLTLLLATFASLLVAPPHAFAATDPGLLISELLANPPGNDANQEYVELIATRSINFATTPYSVVFANNGTATSAGYVAGGTITYGFAITSGTVARGDVVYVGGTGMAPTGPRLRQIDVTTTGGDRFGNAGGTAGVLGNGGTN